MAGYLTFTASSLQIHEINIQFRNYNHKIAPENVTAHRGIIGNVSADLVVKESTPNNPRTASDAATRPLVFSQARVDKHVTPFCAFVKADDIIFEQKHFEILTSFHL